MSIVVHKHGILQFINVYKMYCNRCCAELRWGDEVGTFFVYSHRSNAILLFLITRIKL